VGIDYGIYVGPYAKCLISKKADILRTRKCSNALCETKPIIGEFCSTCGSKVVNVDVPCEVDVQNRAKICALLYEALISVKIEGCHVWYSNRLCNFGTQIDSVRDFPLVEAFEKHVQADEVNAFESLFEKELNILREQYGADAVFIQWGLVGSAG